MVLFLQSVARYSDGNLFLDTDILRTSFLAWRASIIETLFAGIRLLLQCFGNGNSDFGVMLHSVRALAVKNLWMKNLPLSLGFIPVLVRLCRFYYRARQGPPGAGYGCFWTLRRGTETRTKGVLDDLPGLPEGDGEGGDARGGGAVRWLLLPRCNGSCIAYCCDDEGLPPCH